MKSSVEETYNFIREHNLSPEMLTLRFNETNTRAKVVFRDAGVQASFFMKIENAKKFINDVRKKYYEKPESNIKRIK